MDSNGKLSYDDRKQLLKWANPGRRELQLLYSFTKDGASASTFHTKCDNRGPTVTAIYNTQGSVYGGYTTQHWDSSKGTYKIDALAFLFSLRQSDKRMYVKFPVKNATYAIHCQSSYGPTFGDFDLQTFTSNLSSEDKTYTLNGSFNFGTSYDTLNTKTDDITNNIMTVTELEVYGFRGTALENIPWRNSPELTKKYLDSLKDEIEQFVPSTRFSVSRSNILLVGQVGSGKSSFINNVDSIFRGQLTHRAICGIAENSVTLKYRIYPIQSGTDDKTMNFRLCDTRGLEVSHGIKPQDMMYLLDGHVQDGYAIKRNIKPQSQIVRHFVVADPYIIRRVHNVQTCPKYGWSGHKSYDTLKMELRWVHDRMTW